MLGKCVCLQKAKLRSGEERKFFGNAFWSDRPRENNFKSRSQIQTTPASTRVGVFSLWQPPFRDWHRLAFSFHSVCGFVKDLTDKLEVRSIRRSYSVDRNRLTVCGEMFHRLASKQDSTLYLINAM